MAYFISTEDDQEHVLVYFSLIQTFDQPHWDFVQLYSGYRGD